MITFQKEIGIDLYRRAARGIVLTPAGQVLYSNSRSILRYEERIKHHLHYLRYEEVVGNLRIVCSPTISSDWFLTALKKFTNLYPYLSIDITLQTRNILLDETDIYIAPFYSENGQIAQTFLLTSTLSFYSSQSYLDTFGTPESFSDFTYHRLIGVAGGANNLANEPNPLFVISQDGCEPSRHPTYVSNTMDGAITLTRTGHGICEIPDEFAKLYPELVPIALPYSPNDLDIYFNHLGSRESFLPTALFKLHMQGEKKEKKNEDEQNKNETEDKEIY